MKEDRAYEVEVCCPETALRVSEGTKEVASVNLEGRSCTEIADTLDSRRKISGIRGRTYLLDLLDDISMLELAVPITMCSRFIRRLPVT